MAARETSTHSIYWLYECQDNFPVNGTRRYASKARPPHADLIHMLSGPLPFLCSLATIGALIGLAWHNRKNGWSRPTPVKAVPEFWDPTPGPPLRRQLAALNEALTAATPQSTPAPETVSPER